MSHDHKITYYACRHIHSQCRCFSGDKLIVTLPGLCPTCATPIDAPKPDSTKPTLEGPLTLEELRVAVEAEVDHAARIAGACGVLPLGGIRAALDAYAREVATVAWRDGEATAMAADYIVTDAPTQIANLLRSLGLAEGEEG